MFAADTIPSQIQPVLLFGEVLFDRFPERDVLGGAPFNVAHHLLGLGRRRGLWPILISRVGNDGLGRRLLQAIQAVGLTIEGIQCDSIHPTGVVHVQENSDSTGHSFEITPDQAWDYIQPVTNLPSLDHAPEWIYFGTLAQRAGSHIALRALLQRARPRCFVDVNLRDPWVREDIVRWSMQQAEVVKLSEAELLQVANMCGVGSGRAFTLAKQLIHAFDIRQLLVTQGESGAWVMTGDGFYQTSQASTDNTVHVVDTVGAGDAFAAVYLLGLMLNWPVQLTIDRAHRFAAQVCNLRGAIPESLDFYDPFIMDWRIAEEERRV